MAAGGLLSIRRVQEDHRFAGRRSATVREDGSTRGEMKKRKMIFWIGKDDAWASS